MRPENDGIGVVFSDVIKDGLVGCSLCDYTLDRIHTARLCLLDTSSIAFSPASLRASSPATEASTPAFVSTT